MTAPRLHVLTAKGCDQAVVLRRGPKDWVASLIWDRATGTVELGQWLHARLYEHRADLSPDGRHMIYFAARFDERTHGWTAISRAPWLTALTLLPQEGTWYGGGAFTPEGRVFFNGARPPDNLPDGLQPAEPTAYPHGTDGFHMGGLYPMMMQARGWRQTGGEGYETVLEKPAGQGWTLELGVALRRRNRALISNRYALRSAKGATLDQPDWEWAEPWGEGLQVAARGALWQVPLTQAGPGRPSPIQDFNDMEIELREAPYEGVGA